LVLKPQIVTIAPAIGLLDGDWRWVDSLDDDKAKKALGVPKNIRVVAMISYTLCYWRKMERLWISVHRLKSVKNWRSIRLSQIETEVEKLTARIVANMCRKGVSKKDKIEWISKLAGELKKQGVEKGEITKRISKLTGMTDAWVRMLHRFQ
jgi:hypothetical protein